MEYEVYNLTIPMKDGTTHHLSVTRYDIEDWLTEHDLTKLLDSDDNRLLSNYAKAYKNDYNKTHPKPKGQRGGAREGAGRKAKSGGSFHHGFRFSARVHNILLEHAEDMTGFVETAILAYDRAYGTRKRDDD
mgnify:FL=1